MQDRFLTRYYDTKTEQIIKLNTIINTCENGLDIEFYGICVSGDGQISQVELDKNEQRFKRMQCSGLKDRNGKLIYEGDILKFQFGNTLKTGIVNCTLTVWDVSDAQIVQGAWCGSALINCHKHSEIIGNIYENPELIGGAK